MKTKLRTTAVLLAIVLMAATSVSANRGYGRNTNMTEKSKSCVTDISGLSQSQMSAIERLESDHQKVMEQLRTERRATRDEKTKAEVRVKMLTQRDNHQQAVKNLLSPEQQVQYNALHVSGNHYNTRGHEGNGAGYGNHSGNGYGNNNGQGKCRR